MKASLSRTWQTLLMLTNNMCQPTGFHTRQGKCKNLEKTVKEMEGLRNGEINVWL